MWYASQSSSPANSAPSSIPSRHHQARLGRPSGSSRPLIQLGRHGPPVVSVISIEPAQPGSQIRIYNLIVARHIMSLQRDCRPLSGRADFTHSQIRCSLIWYNMLGAERRPVPTHMYPAPHPLKALKFHAIKLSCQ